MIAEVLLAPLRATKGFLALEEAVERSVGKPAAAFGLVEGARVAVAGALSRGRRTLIVAPSDQAAMRTAEDLTRCGVAAAHFPARETALFRADAESRELIHRRIAVLGDLLQGKVQVVCAPIEALLLQLMPVAEFREAILTLQPGDEADLSDLTRRLAAAGYAREEAVEGRGQFAVRGGILDVYPVQAMTAYRVEFFGDEVDSVREMDVLTQRSTPTDAPLLVYPATEACASPAQMRRAADLLEGELSALRARAPKKRAADDAPWLSGEDEEEAGAARPARKALLPEDRRPERIEALRLGKRGEALENFVPYLYEKPAYFSDYFDPELVVLEEAGRLRERAQNVGLEFYEQVKNALERQEAFPGQQKLLDTWDNFVRILEKRRSAVLGHMQVGLGDLRLSAICNIETRQIPDFQGQNALLVEELNAYRQKGTAVALLTGGRSRGERLRDSLRERDLPVTFAEGTEALAPGEVAVIPLGLSRGFALPEANFAALGDADLFGTTRQRAARRRRKAGEAIRAFTDLKVGDYVVHESHGIGVYTGIARMTMQGKTRDYLHIQYQGTDALYVPTDQLDRVQKYIGMENKPPRLNKLGGTELARSKARVKGEILKMAD